MTQMYSFKKLSQDPILSSAELKEWAVLTHALTPKLGFPSDDAIKHILQIPSDLSKICTWLYKQSGHELHILLLTVQDSDIADALKSSKSAARPSEKLVQHVKQLSNQFTTQANRDIMSRSSSLGLNKVFFRAVASGHVVGAFISDLKSSFDKSGDKNISENEEFARSYFIKAQQLNASDIHIESDGVKANLFMRINKDLHLFDRFEHKKAVDFGNSCYTTFNISDNEQSNSGTYVHRNHMEGEFVVPNTTLKGRFLSLYHGQADRFNIVIRVIDKAKSVSARPFSEMGMSEHVCRQLSILETLSSGGVFMAGVTGSGKSTTMQNMILNEIARSGGTRKIYSLEQPVEQVIPGVSQISVDGESAANLTKSEGEQMGFSVVNKKLMRGDPDTIAYGEIRDAYSAAAAYKGVDSGHLVYGTVHVDSALGAFGRLVDFDLPINNVCRPGFMKVVLHQHLIAKICPKCSKKYNLGEKFPPRFSEEFLLKSTMKSSDISVYMEKSRKNGGRSIFRLMQDDGLLTSKHVSQYRDRLEMLNAGNDQDAMANRIYELTQKAAIRTEDVNIRLKGSGCDHPKCFNGTIGVTPAIEIVVPDNTLLDFLKQRDLGRANLYWRSALGGKSSMEDMTLRLLTGVVDPWNTEQELGCRIGEQ